MGKILLVEDQRNLRRVLAAFLRREGHVVTEAANGLEAVQAVQNSHFDLVLTDLKMEPVNGMEVLRKTKETAPKTEVIVITAYGTVSSGVEAMKLGAYDYLQKPLENEKLKLVVERAIEKHTLAAEVDRLQKEIDEKYNYENIIGKSDAMRKVLKIIPQVAATDSTVLILGESGTGKELLARAIHQSSPRRNRPWVALNCGGLVDSLLESELFGYVKGAFTGATRNKMGLVQHAHTGTLFLDEIAEMSLPTQVKVLRFLESGEVRRLGDTVSTQVDVRLIAATNVDLRRAVEEHKFREDLYYRLHVIPIYLPPLRERRDDIELLSYHFLSEFAKKFHKNLEGFSKRALVLLRNYDWPGNVRQLRNVLERAVVLSTGRRIEPGDLPFQEFQPDFFENLGVSADLPSLGEVEQRYIRTVLEKVQGNQKAAAEILGISQTTLWRKLKN